MFGKYHYLSHSHNNAAKVYIATVEDEPCGFLSTLYFPHPKAKNIRKIHRLVVSPDYQGLGIGGKLLNEVATIEKKGGFRVSLVTSAPSLIYSIAKDNNWICKHHGRAAKQSSKSSLQKYLAQIEKKDEAE